MTGLPSLWHDFVAAHPEHAGTEPSVEQFGDGPEMADELLALVLAGTKRATAGVAEEGVPVEGSCWVVTDGRGEAGAVLQTVEIRVGRLDSVDDAFAYDEGEGDRTRAWWLDAHRDYFRRNMPDLTDVDALPTVFERFRVVWPSESADRPVTELQTERLILRRWRESDRAPFAAMNADPEVMEHFPAPLSRAASDAMVDRITAHFDTHGWGLWAVETDDGRFAGFTGLNPVPAAVADVVSGNPTVEVGWRLARWAWGHGYATEAATVAVRHGFDVLGLDEIVSFTAAGNLRSRAVMERLGMTRDPVDDFEHPAVPADSPLRHHLLYRLACSETGNCWLDETSPPSSGR